MRRIAMLLLALYLLCLPASAAVAYDNSVALGDGTGDRSFDITPVGTPRGVLVLIFGVNTDNVVGVTADGVTMVEVSGSPAIAAAEVGSHAFFLGSGIPNQTLTIAIDVNDTTNYGASAITLTAATDTNVHDTTVSTTTVANPSVVLTITLNSFCAGVLGSGFTTVPGAGSNKTMIGSIDFGIYTGGASRCNSNQTTDFTYGFSQNSDDVALIAVAITENLIAFDAVSNSGYQTAASTYNWSHTFTGSERLAIAGVSMLSVAGSSVSSITCGVGTFTFIGSRSSAAGTVRIEQWQLIAPPTGAQTCTVTLSTGLDSVTGIVSFTGVQQTSPTEGFNSDTALNVGAADATVNVTTVADNDWVLDTVATSDGAITVGAGQTSRWNVAGALGSGAGSHEGPKTPAGSVTMSWTNVDAVQTWTIGAVAVRPAGASSGFKRLSLLGVGQ